MSHKFFDMTFTESVKAMQQQMGSRKSYARSETGDPDFFGLSDSEKRFIEARDSFYMATVSSTGQPYIQFRGGAPGFLKILDDRTLGFADFRGNKQYITTGNLMDNNKVALFLMDYPTRTRLKILATVDVIESSADTELIDKLSDDDYDAMTERAMILRVEAYDWNCQQHITPRFTMEQVNEMIAPLYEHIEMIERENKRLKDLVNSTKQTSY